MAPVNGLPRYSLAPLVALSGLSGKRFIVAFRVSGTDYSKGVSRHRADRLAVRAGFHPYEIWPEMIVEDFDAADVRDAELAEMYERKLQKNRARARRTRVRRKVSVV